MLTAFILAGALPKDCIALNHNLRPDAAKITRHYRECGIRDAIGAPREYGPT